MPRSVPASGKPVSPRSLPRGAEGDLSRYRQMRDFAKTPEPGGEVLPESGEGLRFVIQKHAARRLHYDLRLELGGVFKSWAVARGPSLDPHQKRLAVHVEDHPIDYGDFEGIIPKGEYGGGTVMIWDRGFWRPEGDPAKAYEKGHLAFKLNGEKLKGRWHLIRTKGKPREKKEQWLLFKSDDEFAQSGTEGDVLEVAPDSVATHRSMAEIGEEKAAVWSSQGGLVQGSLSPAGDRPPHPSPLPEGRGRRKSNPPQIGEQGRRSGRVRSKGSPLPEEKETGEPPARGDESNGVPSPAAERDSIGREFAGADPSAIPGAKKAAFPGFVEPCLALLADKPPEGEHWLHEIKYDGYRLVAVIAGGRIRLFTRRGLDWTERFQGIAEALEALPVTSAIIDGEAVIEDEQGVSSFSAMQDALSDHRPPVNAALYAFDLIYLDGYDLRQAPLDQRKDALARLLGGNRAAALRYSEHVTGNGRAMLEHSCRLGLEGVVSKRRDSPYRSGRHGEWTKAKCTNRAEFVIGGYVPSTAARNAVGSLALGAHEAGKLIHVGRTGTGFTQRSAQSLYKMLEDLRSRTSPFANTLTSEERRGLVFVEPRLVAEVEFRGWTHDRHLRHAAFKGLREDKPAGEVEFEMPRNEAAGSIGKAKKAASARTAPASPVQSKGGTLEIAGVKLTHPDRVLWEQQGITKLGLAEYYVEVAGLILPYITGRPLALVRCPSGSSGCFYQKHSFAGLTDAVEIIRLPEKDGEAEAIVIHDLRGLINLVQANVLEIHPWGARAQDAEHPDILIFDLDPGEGVEWTAVIEGAREIRQRLRGTGIESFVKTTGGKGLHVVSHLEPSVDWDALKTFAHGIALAMEADNPSKYISTMAKKARGGKIFVDYLRNGRGATAVAAYSTRARPGAPVSTPVAWDELGPELTPARFTVANIGRRLAALKSDPWDGFWTSPQPVAEAMSRARSKRGGRAPKPGR